MKAAKNVKPVEPKQPKTRPAWSVRLQIARKSVEGNQTTFAEQLGISQPRYSQYESGKRDIPPEVLEMIVKRYPRIDLNFVFGAAPNRPLDP